MNQFCGQCGTRADSADRYCVACGTELRVSDLDGSKPAQDSRAAQEALAKPVRLTFFASVGRCYRNYAKFHGRATRAEYWNFNLLFLLVVVTSAAMEALFVTSASDEQIPGLSIFAFSGAIVILSMIVPSIAVGVRRLHDTGRSGAWLLISLVPIVGSIVLLIFLCQSAEEAPNRYGFR